MTPYFVENEGFRGGDGRDFEFIDFWTCTTESSIRLSLWWIIKAEAAHPNQVNIIILAHTYLAGLRVSLQLFAHVYLILVGTSHNLR
jgi:hypothetical protein